MRSELTTDAVNPGAIRQLASPIEGDLLVDETMRRLYATNASEYQEMPLAVAFPKTEEDVRQIILFAGQHKIGIIPRTAGTSLAGQVVGHGLVVDLSRHFNVILSIDQGSRRVRVQSGVVRNELNLELANHGLFFGPETSTANRAMIGVMVGNNSCGSNSIVYGSTREHLVSVRGFFSDGSEGTLGALGVVEPPTALGGFDAEDFTLNLVAVARAIGQEREPLLHLPIPPAVGGSYGGRGFVSSHA